MRVTRRHVLGALAVTMALPVVKSAHAHHGFRGRYNVGKPVWIEGEVLRATFAPPHPVLTVSVLSGVTPTPPSRLPHGLSQPPATRKMDADRTVNVEFPPVGTFYRMYDSIRVGDRIAIIALENCQPPNQLRSQWVRTASGKVIVRERRMSYMVDTCEQS